MILESVNNNDIATIVAAIVAAVGGVQGVRTLIKRAGRLIEIAEQLEAKSAKLDEVVSTIERHSVRLAELERGVLAFNDFDGRLLAGDMNMVAIMESLEYGAWISDNNGLCVYANPALVSLMMTTRDNVIGASWKDCIHPEDREFVVGKWTDFVRGERSVFMADFRYQSPDGKKDNAVTAMAIRPVLRGKRSDRIFGWAKPRKTP